MDEGLEMGKGNSLIKSQKGKGGREKERGSDKAGGK